MTGFSLFKDIFNFSARGYKFFFWLFLWGLAIVLLFFRRFIDERLTFYNVPLVWIFIAILLFFMGNDKRVGNI